MVDIAQPNVSGPEFERVMQIAIQMATGLRPHQPIGWAVAVVLYRGNAVALSSVNRPATVEALRYLVAGYDRLQQREGEGAPQHAIEQLLNFVLPNGTTYQVAGQDVDALADMLEMHMQEDFDRAHPEAVEKATRPADRSAPERVWVNPFCWSDGHTIGALRTQPPREASIDAENPWREYVRVDAAAAEAP